jgi:hypothetical protein
MIDQIIEYQWEVFIALEVFSIVSLLLFGVMRYLFDKRKFSVFFLICFIALLLLEAILAILIYLKTGRISTFQVVITIFVLYACTFGIFDFLKLDRWMRKKMGELRGVRLLTDKDVVILNQQKDPKYVAKKYRRSAMMHLIVFVIIQTVFMFYGTNNMYEWLDYLSDLSWIGTNNIDKTPYANEPIYRISMVWGLIFIIDFIYSWSYTIIPSKSKG